jgi:hypothetical protein
VLDALRRGREADRVAAQAIELGAAGSSEAVDRGIGVVLVVVEEGLRRSW